MRNRLAVFASLALLAFSTAARADTEYTSLSDFNAAVKNSTTETFGTDALSGGFATAAGSYGGITLSSNGTLHIDNANFGGSPYPDGNYITGFSGSPNVITIGFASSSAFGLDLTGFSVPTSFLITLSDGQSFTVNPPDDASVSDFTSDFPFFGFTTTTAITSATLTFTGQNLFDNVTTATANNVSATPEPSSFILLGTGVLSLAGAARRKFLKA